MSERIFEKVYRQVVEHSRNTRSTTSKKRNSKFLDCTFRVYPGDSMQILAATQEQVLTDRDAIGKNCTPETYTHGIIFVGMMNELAVSPNVHRSDEENVPSATVLCNFAGRFRPGFLDLRRTRFRKAVVVRKVGQA